MRAVTRWLWHCIPAQIRYRLYHRIMNSTNRAIRAMVWFAVAVTLRNHRLAVSHAWPDVRGADRIALTLWSVLTRFHSLGLELMWQRGYLVRRFRAARRVDPSCRTVLHATGSFDLGGTQTQIKHLCIAEASRFEHRAVEIFPELNFLYRRGVAIDANRYVGGGLLSRTFGRLVVSRNYRSSQLIQIFKLVCDIRAERPDVVVGWGHEMCITAFIAAAFARVPRVIFCIRTVDPTNYWVNEPIVDWLTYAHRRCLPYASKVVVNSTLLQADHAAWMAMPPEDIAVCPNGIDIRTLPPDEAAAARIRVRETFGIPASATVIVNVGRFSHEKGQRSLVEANALLLARGTAPPFYWLLCGDGPTLPDVTAAAERLGQTNIRFAGRTDRVQDMLAAADIFVMPSFFEGMPNAMMEAMAAGLPCVSTIRSGAVDVARPDREALYYEPGDATQLAIHLQRLLDHPDDAAAMGAAAAARIREFSVARFITSFDDIVEEVRAAAR
jgi:glycosyltransferase involved in cell wall biosynthesis